jgi:hypothetical protein
MAYRASVAEGATACHRHPAAPSVDVCRSCGRTVCEPCITFFDTQAHCYRCAKHRRNLRAGTRGALGLAALIGLLYLARAGATDHKPTKVRSAPVAVPLNACSETAIRQAALAILAARDYGAARAVIDDLSRDCVWSDAQHVHTLDSYEVARAIWRGAANVALRRTDAALDEYCAAISASPDRSFVADRIQALRPGYVCEEVAGKP